MSIFANVGSAQEELGEQVITGAQFPEGFAVMRSSLSPDKHYGVLAPVDFDHYDETKHQNKLDFPVDIDVLRLRDKIAEELHTVCHIHLVEKLTCTVDYYISPKLILRPPVGRYSVLRLIDHRGVRHENAFV